MDTGRFNLLCVYDPAAIIKAWPVITGGIEVMLENSGSDTSMDKIFNELMAGQLLLWVGMLDGDYVGFATTKIIPVPPDKQHLWIVHAYKKIKVSTGWLMLAYKKLEEFAILQKCTSIRFYGLRSKWHDRFKALGFNESYVEMVKSL